MVGTLAITAKDAKIQVEFNFTVFAEHRLIGYENRGLKREDFNNDKGDAGEIGAGHSVTALYEVSLVGSRGLRNDALRYQSKQPPRTATDAEMAHLRIRFQQPTGARSQLLETPIASPLTRC